MSLLFLILVTVILLVTVIAIAGVTGDYGHKPFAPGRFPTQVEGITAYDVQIDDFGNYWDKEAAETTLATIAASARRENVVVVLFIHGWHHNAHRKDENRKDFAVTLDALQKRLRDENYEASRTLIGVGGPAKVIGIYLSWRGRALPGWLDYLTVWGRKNAAQTIGDRAARDFILSLNEIYKAENARPDGTFMGLVTAGHSLGAQVLFKAVAPSLEQSARAPTPVLSGIGDVVILLNPAMEALQFANLDRLYQLRTYSRYQTPLLLVFSGEKDTARQRFFPLARRASAIFQPTFANKEEAVMWRIALGEYEPQRTHKFTPEKIELTFPTDYCAAVLPIDFSGNQTLPTANIEPLEGRHRPYSPVLVAYSSDELIEGHTGIFKEEFRDFLISYVALIEGKRICVLKEAAAAAVRKHAAPG